MYVRTLPCMVISFLFVQPFLLYMYYRSVGSKSLSELLQKLEKEDIPVLLCITHGDCLCADICTELTTEDGSLPTIETMKHRLELELKVRAFTTILLLTHRIHLSILDGKL